jgi:hypothetical protein
VQSGRRKCGRLPPGVLRRYATELPDATILWTDFPDKEEDRTIITDRDGDHVFLSTDGAVLRAYQARGPGDGKPREWVRVRVIE